MKTFLLIIFFVLSSCSTGANFASKISEGDSFFLCFPSANTAYSELSLEEKVELQKKIALEKNKRNLVCEEYSELTSAEDNLEQLNQREMSRRLNKCIYRGEPCRYD